MATSTGECEAVEMSEFGDPDEARKVLARVSKQWWHILLGGALLVLDVGIVLWLLGYDNSLLFRILARAQAASCLGIGLSITIAGTRASRLRSSAVVDENGIYAGAHVNDLGTIEESNRRFRREASSAKWSSIRQCWKWIDSQGHTTRLRLFDSDGRHVTFGGASDLALLFQRIEKQLPEHLCVRVFRDRDVLGVPAGLLVATVLGGAAPYLLALALCYW